MDNCSGNTFVNLSFSHISNSRSQMDNISVGKCFNLSDSLGGRSSSLSVPEPPLYIMVCVTVIYIIIFLSGVIGNSLVIFVVFRNRDMRTATNYFLVNLSVADLLVIVICMPPAFVDLHAKEVWYFGSIMCRVVPLMENAVALGSVLTILAISFERYYAICHPLKVQYTCTVRRMLKIVSVVWLISLATCSPFLNIAIYKDSNLVDGTPVKVCRTYIVYVWQKIFIFLLTAVFFVFPLCMLVIVYTIISKKLVSDSLDSKMKSDHVNRSNMKGRRQVVAMLFAVVVIFFLSLLPMETVRLWSIFATRQDYNRLGFEGYLNVVYFSRVMLYLNSNVNPFIYNMMSTKFREAFKKAIGMKTPRKLTFRSTLTSNLSGTYSQESFHFNKHRHLGMRMSVLREPPSGQFHQSDETSYIHMKKNSNCNFGTMTSNV